MKKKYAQTEAVGLSPMKGPDSWQCEEDVRTLTRAAEVVADRGRASMAMKRFRKTQVGMDKLVNVLGSRRRSL